MEQSREKFAKKSPGMADVARLAGVSKNTVSLSLKDSPLISEKTKKKILKVAASIGYEKNMIFSRFMSEIKMSGLKRYRETIALINANESHDAFKKHPTIPKYVEGIKRAAEREGFAINEFWLYDPDLSGRSLTRVLKTRGIRGGIVTGLMDNNRLPAKFKEVWSTFKFVITGVRTYEPTLNFSIADHYLIAYQAVQRALEYGYERPALVLDKKIDELIEGRFTGGFLRAQLNMPRENRIEPFFAVKEAREDISIFFDWYKRNRPNAIICLYNSVKKWVDELGIKVPQELALIQLERRDSESEWAGLNQRNDLVGESAVERLSQLLYSPSVSHSGVPTATLVSPEWIDSATICARKKKPR